MRTPHRILVVAAVVTPLLGSCIFNAEEKPPDTGQPPPAYKALDVKDNLLDNLELAYNQRNIEEYKKLLDPTPGVFLFHFSPTDVSEGRVSSSQWGWDEEIGSATNMFSRRPPPPQPAADDIKLELNFAGGDQDWLPRTPPSHPSEVWYDKPVEYTLRVTVGPTVYTQNKAVQALFTVRWTEINGDSVYQIVTWKDDV